MKKTHLILLATTACAITALATACQTKVREKFEISISARSLVSEQNMLNLWKAEYEKLHPNTVVKVSGWGSNEGTSESYVLKNALNRSYLTNICYTTDDSTANLAMMKNFVDLRPYYESDPETDYTKYYSSMLDTTSFYGEFRPTTSYTGDYESEKSDDSQYGVYFAPREYNMPAILCNVTLMKNHLATESEKANWDKDSIRKLLIRLAGGDETTKWSWSTFVLALQAISKTCENLNASGDLGYRACELNAHWEPVYTTIMKELGGDGLFSVDSRGEVSCNLDSNANKAAYASIQNDFNRTTNKYMVETDEGNDNFANRNVFMVFVSYPEVGSYYEAFKKVDYELGAINIPCKYVGAGCGGYAIFVDKAKEVQTLKSGETAKTADLCWDFIKYIISKDGQNVAGKEGYIQPVLKELAETGDWLDSYDGKIDNVAFETGEELRLDTYCFAEPDMRNDLRTAISQFFRYLFGSSGTDLNKTISEVNRILSGN